MHKSSIPLMERRKIAERQWLTENPKSCLCGCGVPIDRRRAKFKRGHHMKNPKYNRKGTGVPIVNVCVQCGTKFIAKAGPRARQDTCSIICRGMKRRKRSTYTCRWCKKEFVTHLYQANKRQFFTRDCQRSMQEFNKLTGNTVHYRKTAYANYRRRCCMCGWGDHPEVLVVHHDDENRKNNDPENLAVVCPTCHAVIHFLRGSRHPPLVQRLGSKRDG